MHKRVSTNNYFLSGLFCVCELLVADFRLWETKLLMKVLTLSPDLFNSLTWGLIYENLFTNVKIIMKNIFWYFFFLYFFSTWSSLIWFAFVFCPGFIQTVGSPSESFQVGGADVHAEAPLYLQQRQEEKLASLHCNYFISTLLLCVSISLSLSVRTIFQMECKLFFLLGSRWRSVL